MGGKRNTAYELAGVGDLIGTSLCPESRNRSFGECLGKGMSAKHALKRMKQTVEGVDAVHCLLRLAEKHRVETRFAKAIFACVNEKGDPRLTFKKFISTL